MRTKLMLSSCVALASTLLGEPLQGQGEAYTASVHAYYASSFTLMCPDNTIVIGVQARGVIPLTIICSLYKADGTRFGPASSQTRTPDDLTLTDKIQPGTVLAPLTAPPLSTVNCPGNTAVASFKAFLDDRQRLNAIQVYCAGIGATGGQTIASLAGVVPNGATVESTNPLTCPVPKFAQGVIVMNEMMALKCIDAPRIANAVANVTLSAFQTISGNAVRGTVTLNGYAFEPTTINLNVADAPGAIVPSMLTVPTGERSSNFQIQSAPSTAGCGIITATLGTSRGPSSASVPLIFAPPLPSVAGIGGPVEFFLQPSSTSLLWSAPSTITAVVAGVVGASDVQFESSQPDVLAIQQASVHKVGKDTLMVTMNSLKTGCSVVSAIVNGVALRKTMRFAMGF